MMATSFKRHIQPLITGQVSLAPLVVFRVLFGAVMFISIVRFMVKGWVHELYIQPGYYFSYYGFEWVQPLGETGMYTLFSLLLISSLGIMLGFRYKMSITLFFLAFTYVELIDKTNYLNHYYFVSLISFLMIFLPAHRLFSFDAWINPSLERSFAPAWTVNAIRLQLGLLYFFAGIAKLNPEWMLEANPMKIWLPAHSELPIIGSLLAETSTAYVFSWAGAVYDLSIAFFLCFTRTRTLAYTAVVIFHLATAFLFPIGMFPYIMIISTLIFFPAKFHQRLLSGTSRWFGKSKAKPEETPQPSLPLARLGLAFLSFVMVIQLVLPMRYLLYPGELFWTEEGYRFSWRVMLMEKAGYAIFHIKDPESGREGEAYVSDYLTPNQEKMMSTQPDMILQFAHFLENEYKKQGIRNPEVRAEVYVSLNGEGSRLFIDPSRDLTKVEEGFAHKDWILPYRS